MDTSGMILSIIEKERRLKHALKIVDTFDSFGKHEGTRYFHYLTCEKCRLRKILNLPILTDEEIINGRELVQRNGTQ